MATALVTGGNRGIGLEVCRQLARAGYDVLLGCRDPRDWERAARGIAETGGVTPVRLDVRDPRQVEAVAAAPVDVLVNNAGTYDTTPLGALDSEALQRSLDVHLLGAFRLISAFLPRMNEAGRGRIVNVSSGAVRSPTACPDPRPTESRRPP